MTWLNEHGFALLIFSYIFALVISGMPPLPQNAGFFRTWAYNVLQIMGANADKLVKKDPRLASFTQAKKETTADGTETETKTLIETKASGVS